MLDLDRITKAMTIKYLLLLTLAVAGCSSLHLGVEQACVDPVSRQSADQNSLDAAGLHVVTWNLHGPPNNPPMAMRIRRIGEELLARRPVLITLQEVWFEGDADLLANSLSALYDVIPDDPVIHTGFLHAVSGFRRGGLLAFVRKGSGWSLSRDRGTSSFYFYKNVAAPYRITEGDGVSDKGIQRFDLEKDGLHLVIFNTHLQSQYGDGRRYVGVRLAQVRELNGQLALDVSKEGAARSIHIALGDFNTTPYERSVYGEVTTAWDDLTKELRSTCDCSGSSLDLDDGNTVEADWIDYVFSQKQSQVRVERPELIKSSSMDCPFSDHYGLDVRLALPK